MYMKHMYDKHKAELMKEMHKAAEKPLTRASAQYMAMCYDAYKAICMMCDEDEDEDDEEYSEYSGNYDVEVDKDHMSVTRTGKKSKSHKLTEAEAKKWVSHMKNEDGTTGEHFTMDEVKKAMSKMDMSCEPYELWVAVNSIYSDIGEELQRFGVNSVESYADIAYEYWFEDEDAVPNKLAVYYHNVVKH